MKNALFLGLAVFCLLFVNNLSAQSIVEDLNISPEEASIQMADKTNKNYLVEIGGPNAYYFKQNINETREIHISNHQADGKAFPDGTYTLQITPIYETD